MKNLYDLAVVGAGPVGSRLACRMAEMGHRVVVLERRSSIGQKSCCTGIIGQECARDFGIEDGVVLRQVNSARLFSPSGRQLYLRREEPQACILDRSKFDLAMARRAQEAGAQYVLDCPVKDVAVSHDGVKLTNGQGQRFEAKVVALATGFGSALVKNLGLGEVGDFALGAQVEADTSSLDEVEVYFGRELAAGFFGWLVPLSSHTARVGLLARSRPGLHLRRLLARLQQEGKVVSAEVKFQYGVVPLRPARKTVGDRVVVVGDAAGQVKPTSGGGIYYGLLCADLAAKALHQALERNDLSAKGLAAYERAWRKRLGGELRTGYWARRLFERLSDQQVDHIFEIMDDKGIAEALLRSRDLSFDWHGKVAVGLMRYGTVAMVAKLTRLPAWADKFDQHAAGV